MCFESGIQHFADSVEAYRALAPAAKQFLQHVPAAWDETRGIAGEPGTFVVIARRDNQTWYVGGLNADTPTTARVPLAFLGSGLWTMTLIGDGAVDREFKDSTRSVMATEVVDVPMRPRGGFVMRIFKSSVTAVLQVKADCPHEFTAEDAEAAEATGLFETYTDRRRTALRAVCRGSEPESQATSVFFDCLRFRFTPRPAPAEAGVRRRSRVIAPYGRR